MEQPENNAEIKNESKPEINYKQEENSSSYLNKKI